MYMFLKRVLYIILPFIAEKDLSCNLACLLLIILVKSRIGSSFVDSSSTPLSKSNHGLTCEILLKTEKLQIYI